VHVWTSKLERKFVQQNNTCVIIFPKHKDYGAMPLPLLWLAKRTKNMVKDKLVHGSATTIVTMATTCDYKQVLCVLPPKELDNILTIFSVKHLTKFYNILKIVPI
jgi:hypothetical protein